MKSIKIEPRLSPVVVEKDTTNMKQVVINDMIVYLEEARAENEYLKHIALKNSPFDLTWEFDAYIEYDEQAFRRITSEWQALAATYGWVKCPACSGDIPSKERIGETKGRITLIDNLSFICDSCHEKEVKLANEAKITSLKAASTLADLLSGDDLIGHALLEVFGSLGEVKSPDEMNESEFGAMMMKIHKKIPEKKVIATLDSTKYTDPYKDIEAWISVFYLGLATAFVLGKYEALGISDEEIIRNIKRITGTD